MGTMNPFKAPKAPAPVMAPPPVVAEPPKVLEAPKIDDPVNQTELDAERKRRAGAAGTSGNIVTSLASAKSDIQTSSKRSTLLGG